VAANSRAKRDGRFLEDLGLYMPRGESQLAINEERAMHWLKVGARPSAGVARLLKRAGVGAATAAAPVKG